MSKNSTINGPKVGLFSDIHIGLGQDSPMWHQSIIDFAKWAVEIYYDRGINEIIIPGDIFHNRNEISVNTLSKAKEFFDVFKEFKLYISTGNHDCYYKDRSDVNSISLLKGWNNITLIDKDPVVFNIKNSSKTVSLIPWGVEVEHLPRTDICIGHFEIISFKMNAFNLCKAGAESMDFFLKSPFVISGHFHHRDFRKYDRGQILYLGSPYQQNFGDTDSERGIYILDLHSNEFDFIKNTISPVHHKISLQSILNKNTNSDFLKKNIPGNMINFVVDCDYPQDKISLVISKLQNLKPKFFRTDYKYQDSSESNGLEDNNFDSLVSKMANMLVGHLRLILDNSETEFQNFLSLYEKIARKKMKNSRKNHVKNCVKSCEKSRKNHVKKRVKIM